MQLITCSFSLLFPYNHIHLPLTWGSLSILLYFHFILCLIYSIAMATLFHYVWALTCHLTIQTIPYLFCIFLAAAYLEFAWPWSLLAAFQHYWDPVPCLCILVINHEMFISISKLHNSWYLLTMFQSNLGCLTICPSHLDILCIGLALLTGYLLLLLPLWLLKHLQLLLPLLPLPYFVQLPFLSCFPWTAFCDPAHLLNINLLLETSWFYL